MKKYSITVIALFLALLIAAQLPMQVFAEEASAQYISDIKIGVGKKAEDAIAALEGYEILKDSSGDYVDLNTNAGGGVGSRGNRVVYLGIKRTDDINQAITDLAVMNMNGGYSVKNYKALMEDYLSEQLIPFVSSFLSAIEEYRENYNSSNAENSARAHYIHDVLNKLTDDDCGGAGLGDLLLNETKFEMGDAAYNALSDAEKNQHADILTIIAQSNGRATALLESLLLKAADTAETTWLERFVEITYDDMEDETGLSPSKAYSELSKLYYDDAMRILSMWDAFKAQLDGYDDAIAKLDEASQESFAQQEAIVENYDILQANSEQTEEFGEALAEITIGSEACVNAYYDVLCKEYLEGVAYDLTDYGLEVETLLDFFTLDYEEIYDNIECLFPLVASLSAGQRAGLDLMTLQDLVTLGMADAESYRNAEFDELTESSIYEGVDRGIYEEGGVALTSDALRTDALSRVVEEADGFKIGRLTYSGLSLATAAVIGLGVSLGVRNVANNAINAYNTKLQALKNAVSKSQDAMDSIEKLFQNPKTTHAQMKEALPKYKELIELKPQQEAAVKSFEDPALLSRLEGRSSLCSKLAIGFTVAIIIIIAVTVWMTVRDLKNYYKVDYSPIPRYIVDEKDITAFNANGDKIVIKNQAAYYKAVPCNRTDDDDFYSVLGTASDLNGDVGKQWLALYAERNENKDPILADSLKFSSSDQIPAGYETGIHMFGSAAVENLNNPLYVWKADAPKVFVYFKLDVGAVTAAGSGFSAGSLAVGFLGGAMIGVLGTALCMSVLKKKKATA